MALACFTNTFLLGNATRSAAVLYDAVMETFNMIGGCMSSLCLFSCYFANEIPYLTISFGILNGEW